MSASLIVMEDGFLFAAFSGYAGPLEAGNGMPPQSEVFPSFG